MALEVTDDDMKLVSALVFGTLVIALNTFPFIFRILNKTEEAKKSDNFNIFIVVINSYAYLLIICVAISTFVHIIDLIDEVDYLNLLGSGGAFETFWTTGIVTTSSVAETSSYLIKWIRNLYEWICIISAIIVISFSSVAGYQFQKQQSIKNGGGGADVFPFVAGGLGFFLGTLLLFLYSYITKYSLFISSDYQSIIDIIRKVILSSLGI